MDTNPLSRHCGSLGGTDDNSVGQGREERGETIELFRSADLLVRHVGGFSRDHCVVTFDSFTDNRTLDRPGFGQQFLRSRRVDAIHVIARENDWYQYSEIPEAMAAVRAATAGYGRVVTYGSSMGAYAAIRLAGLAGAHCVLALSPQFSIDPAITPFEYRWEEASGRFRAVWERTLAYPVLEQAYVAYDPMDLDAQHMALLDQQFRFTHVQLPGAGHPVTGYLVELGLLEGMLHQACRGEVDVPALQAAAWAGRERSPQYLIFHSMRLAERSAKIATLEQAARLAPGNPDVWCRLGVQLGKAGRFKEADAAHRRSLAIIPGQSNLLLHYSYTAELRGDFAGALGLMEQAVAHSGGGTLYQARVTWLQNRLAASRAPVMTRARKWWARRSRQLRRRLGLLP